uniref:Retrovirus-related Pol polyprotein from transposon TNT 1-94 n=1 Tax=Tanacetum cinerariifolium TaxID=118510 RepID=A0A699H4F6_TANCI|nr:retrovirus-related Pol polyprotein from transposon TNT 1-94 [Tanacetum cinerariifolium]
MTENRSQLINCVRKFLGTVKFGNDHIAKIIGYGDYQMGNVTISRVYYVEGLGHNLFFVGQFYDSNLEVAFRNHTYFIRDLDGVDLLKGSRVSNLYTLSMDNFLLSSLICILSKASKTKSWLWHRRLSYLNFDYITSLAKNGLVRGLPKLKYQKDHLCSACTLHKIIAPKPVVSTGTPSSTTIDQDALSTSTSQTTQETTTLVIPLGVDEADYDIEVSHIDNNPYVDFPIPKPSSKESSTQISQSPKGIFLNQSKYALESLKTYDMETCEPADNPMVEKPKLDKDPQGKAVDLTRYHNDWQSYVSHIQ